MVHTVIAWRCASCIKKGDPGHLTELAVAKFSQPNFLGANSKTVTYPPNLFLKYDFTRGLSARAAVLCNGAPNRKSGNVATNFSAHRLASCSETGRPKIDTIHPYKNKNKNEKRQATTCKQNVSGSDECNNPIQKMVSNQKTAGQSNRRNKGKYKTRIVRIVFPLGRKKKRKSPISGPCLRTASAY